MIRFGLCCIFRDQPIKFRTTTAAVCGRMARKDALAKLSEICLANAAALLEALRFCAENGIGSFRIVSQILPIKTHPQQGYELEELPGCEAIVRQFKLCGEFVREHQLRTCFHPDQFIVLNSARPDVVDASIRELEYQAEVAEWVAADVINIHAGGAFGDKTKALAELAKNVDRLSERARSRLTLENDDKIFTTAELIPWCTKLSVPLVFDVHHHRVHGDGSSVEEATELALTTWNREPLFHLSSPLEGWFGPRPERHHDFIDVDDFPRKWLELDLTVEVEAKAKEVAIQKLVRDLERLKRRRIGRRKVSGQ